MYRTSNVSLIVGTAFIIYNNDDDDDDNDNNRYTLGSLVSNLFEIEEVQILLDLKFF